MRTIKTTTGFDIALDGDLLAVLEALYREVTARRELERTYLFDYTLDGATRRQGFVIISGRVVASVGLQN